MHLKIVIYIIVISALGFGPLMTGSLSAQALISADPDSAMPGEELWLSITGTGTQFEQGSSAMISVSLNNTEDNISASNINVISTDILEAFFAIPGDATPDLYDVIVHHSYYGYTISLPDGFEIYADTTPALVSIDPDSAYQGGNIRVTISGIHTHFGQASSTVNTWLTRGDDTISAVLTSVLSSDSLHAYLNIPDTAATGLWDLYVDDHFDPLLYLLDCFTIIAPAIPEIISIDPDSAWRGDNLEVVITGSHTNFGMGSSTLVWLEQGGATIQGYNVNVSSAELLSVFFSIPTGASFGLWDVWVENTLISATVTKPEGFTVLYQCGDANADNAVNVSDAVWIINYVFLTGSPQPYPMESAEVNCDGQVNISDAVWLINYVFISGPAPCECP